MPVSQILLYKNPAQLSVQSLRSVVAARHGIDRTRDVPFQRKLWQPIGEYIPLPAILSICIAIQFFIFLSGADAPKKYPLYISGQKRAKSYPPFANVYKKFTLLLKAN